MVEYNSVQGKHRLGRHQRVDETGSPDHIRQQCHQLQEADVNLIIQVED